MSTQLRKGETVSLSELARKAQATPAQRIESGLRSNDLRALCAEFAQRLGK